MNINSNTQDDDLKTFFSKLIQRVPDLQAVVVSDRDGVTLLKVAAPNVQSDPSESSLSASFAAASEQAGKLRMGKNNTITSFYDDKIIVHIAHLPLVVSLISNSLTVNVGMLLSFVPDIKRALDPLRNSIQQENDLDMQQ